MSTNPVEDAQEYLARNEENARSQFTASLEGRSTEELIAILSSRKSEESQKNADTIELDGAAEELEEVTLSNVTNSLIENKNMDCSRLETPQMVEKTPQRPQVVTKEPRSAACLMLHTGEMVTKDELDLVRREMVMQERVVQVLEKDNADLLAERRVLRAKVKDMEQKLVNAEAKRSLIASSPQQQFQLHGNTQLARDDNRVELEQYRATIREFQLSEEVLRREKKELEIRLASLDIRRIEEMEMELRNLRVDTGRKEEEHKEIVKDMARKIAWYVKQQESNQSKEELLRKQQETIQRLRTRVHELDTGDAGSTRRPRVATIADTRVRQLTRRVAELEEALQSKHPNSIAQLISSCQLPAQDSKVFRQLQHRIKELEGALADKDRYAEAAIDRLRVDTDQMRVQYQERVERLEEELKLRLLNAQSRRVRDLERQLAEARQALRGRETEKEDLSQTEKERPPTPLHNTAEANAAVHPTHVALTRAVEQLREENAALREQLAQQTTHFFAPEKPSQSPPSQLDHDAAAARVLATLQSQLHTLTAELVIYKRLLADSQDSLRDAHNRWEDRIAAARQEYQTQLQQLRQQHNTDLTHLQESHQRELRKVGEQQRALAESSLAVQAMVTDADGKPRDGDAFLHSVAERLVYLEQRLAQKERETAYELTEMKRVSDFELALVRQKAEMIIEQKNHQISDFRTQLDQLLASLSLMQSQAGVTAA